MLTYVYGQLILPADPYDLIKHEQMIYIQNNNLLHTVLRPQIHKKGNQWSLTLRSELLYNNGAPNLENMGNRIVGKGASFFTGVNLSYSGKFVSFNLEPFYFTTQNKKVEDLNREGLFTRLNDVRHKGETPYVTAGIRGTQIYFNYKTLVLVFLTLICGGDQVYIPL